MDEQQPQILEEQQMEKPELDERGIHYFNPSTFNIVIVVAVIVSVFLIDIGFSFFMDKGEDLPIACTAEAKVCPDGSSVGREGPNCEFAECPMVNSVGSFVSMDEGIHLESDILLATNEFLHSLPVLDTIFPTPSDIDDSNWVEKKINGVFIITPTDWVFRDLRYLSNSPEYRSWDNTLPFRTSDPGFDPTWISVDIIDLGILEILEQNSPRGEHTLEKIIYGESVILKRVNFSSINNCSGIEYFHLIGNQKTGHVALSGVCPSHSPGYDDTKIHVAERVRFQ
jgi:hypothetical protein